MLLLRGGRTAQIGEEIMAMITRIMAAVMAIGAGTFGTALAQEAKDFAGTWTLVSAITEKDGTKSDIFGPNAKGILVFDTGGRYVIAFTSATLPKFASNNRALGTPDENKAIVGGSLAHFGTYTVNEPSKMFAFHVESATFPNWNGTDQERAFAITGDELKYTDPRASAGGVGTIVWKRAK
jgi:hypothetical protein